MNCHKKNCHENELLPFQLCLLLCRLCEFLVADDLSILGTIVMPNLDCCVKYVTDLKKRNVEVVGKFEFAINSLDTILGSTLSPEQCEAAGVLKQILSAQVIAAVE